MLAGTPPPLARAPALADSLSSRGPRALPLAAALYTGLALLYCWPILLSFATRLPSDTGDPGLNTWILWWNSQALPLTTRWWNAPMFYPAEGAFAFSETLLGLAPLASPLQLAGLGPVPVYNLLFLLSIPASALAAHALAYRLTGRHDAALLAGLAFGFSPYRAAQIPHLQMLVACWMPLGLLALHRYLDTRRWSYLLLAGVCWLMNALTSGYLLLFFAVLVALWIAWFIRSPRDLAAVVATLVLASLPLLPIVAGYDRYHEAIGAARGIAEIQLYSADLSAIWAASPMTSFSRFWTLKPRPEGELYPGLILLALVVIAAVASWRALPPVRQWRLRPVLFAAAALAGLLALVSLLTGGQQFQIAGVTISFTRPFKVFTTALWLLFFAIASDRRLVDAWRRRSAFVFYTSAAIVMLVFALGPFGRAFGVTLVYALPYYWLMEVPGGDALRVPARFAILFMLCLGQAAALGFSRLTPGGARRGLVAVLAVAITIEGWVLRMPTGLVPAAADLSSVDPRSIVIELPVVDEYTATGAMLRQTRHRHPIANGYSGYALPHQGIFEFGLRELDETVLAAYQRVGPVAVLVTRDRGDDGPALALMDGIRDARRTATLPVGALYQLPERKESTDPSPGQPLPIASIALSGPDPKPALLVDGDWSTRWEAVPDQVPGDQVLITLAAPATISRVELDLGQYGLDFPRRLRVSVGRDGAPPAQVWEGKTGGLALLGALEDRRRVPIAIDLPAGATGNQILLSLVEEHPKISWSIAEVRVFGGK
ncbi:MAG TPA: hypothetical protein VES67_03800 [Vicinamibacterales bacterium]|nr:hypothetical protein [Vicinamibacterales bacterium]